MVIIILFFFLISDSRQKLLDHKIVMKIIKLAQIQRREKMIIITGVVTYDIIKI